jgi:hypothetical protein
MSSLGKSEAAIRAAKRAVAGTAGLFMGSNEFLKAALVRERVESANVPTG